MLGVAKLMICQRLHDPAARDLPSAALLYHASKFNFELLKLHDLLLDRRQMATGDPVGVATILVWLIRQAQQRANVGNVEPEPAGMPDEGEPLLVLGAIVPVIAFGPSRRPQQPNLFIVAYGLGLRARNLRQLADLHPSVSLDPLATTRIIGRSLRVGRGDKLACNSCVSEAPKATIDPGWRRALWIALAVNAAMFAVELYAGSAADSHALQADALDFFSDAANYAISLLVAGMALTWRARAALLKGITLTILGAYILVSASWAALTGSSPQPETMGIIGFLALVANVVVALMLFRFRSGDSNMRSVWICSRNDAIGNVAVMAAAAGVFGTGTAWPDLIVAGIMATLGIWGGLQIMSHARGELSQQAAHAA